MKTINTLILSSSLVLAASGASAAQLIALGQDGMLHKVDVDSLSVTGSMMVSGASDLRGIDVRPANGMLYALSGGDGIYTINTANGAATAATTLKSALPGDASAVVDFNPKADRLRLLAADGTNFRVNVDNGDVAVDGSVAYAADGAYAGQTAQVVAGAYTNSYPGTETTELFTVDLATGMLMLQNPPNDGVQQAVGELAEGLNGAAMDIASNGSGNNTAYVLTGKTLLTVDLATGTPTTLGEVAGLADGIVDIAVLGSMKELGDFGAAFHAQLAEPLTAANIDYAVLVGEEMRVLARELGKAPGQPLGFVGGFTHCDNAAEAIGALSEYGVVAGDAVLVKGSNSVGLGQLVDHFTRRDG